MSMKVENNDEDKKVITMDKQKWELEVETDPETGDLVLSFPDEILESLGWKEGDLLDWELQEDGSLVFNKVKNE